MSKTVVEVLAELTALEKVATPGPWQSGWTAQAGGPKRGSVYQGIWQDGALVCPKASADDAALIAAMRNALPAFLAVAEAAVDGHETRYNVHQPDACRLCIALARLTGAP